MGAGAAMRFLTGVSPSSALIERFSLDCTSLSVINAFIVRPTEEPGLGTGTVARIGARWMTAGDAAVKRGCDAADGTAAAAVGFTGSLKET